MNPEMFVVTKVPDIAAMITGSQPRLDLLRREQASSLQSFGPVTMEEWVDQILLKREIPSC